MILLSECLIPSRAPRVPARQFVHSLALLALAGFLAGPDVNAQTLPTVSGYSGTQTFVSSPGKDPDEPNACGVVGGASYWFTYKPPTNGCVSLNTSGSSFDTVLAVYVDDGRNLGYASLLPVTCSDNCSTGNLSSCVKFTGSPATNYYIMLDGVNGAYGTAYLNYSLNQRPNISAIPTQTILEDGTTTNINFTVSDREYNATNLALVGISTNQNLVASSNIIFTGTSTNRTVKVIPNKYTFGTNYISVMVQDPGGASNIVKLLLQVVYTNHPPIAFPDTVTRLPGKAITVSRSFPPRNDTDVDGDTLTLSALATKSVGGVTITLTSTNFTYSPATTYTNSDSFTYTVSDGRGKTAIGTNYVTVSTNGVTVVY